MSRIEEIDREIARLTEELERVEGTETEVYSRIVGYYRSLNNWNRGKREEFGLRRAFAIDAPRGRSARRIVPAPVAVAPGDEVGSGHAGAPADVPAGEPVRYELYVRERCPNCPPMKQAAMNMDIAGEIIDVDSDDGIRRATGRAIYATPTIVFLDSDGVETSRTTSAIDLPGRVAVG